MENNDKLNQTNTVVNNEDISNFNNSCNTNFYKNTQIFDIQEKERKRIARDLHDITLQNLTHIIHKLELCGYLIDQDIVRSKLELDSSLNDLRSTISDIRNIIFDLRPMPFDDLSFKDSLTNLISNLKFEYSYNIIFDIDDIDISEDILKVNIYRIIKEACLNAILHSGGNQLDIIFHHDQNFYHVMVKDNGCGFDLKEILNKENHHFGLKMLRERVYLINGKLKIFSDDGGTKIIIDIPIAYQGGTIHEY